MIVEPAEMAEPESLHVEAQALRDIGHGTRHPHGCWGNWQIGHVALLVTPLRGHLALARHALARLVDQLLSAGS